jgi:hypothetical protein
MKVVVIGGTGLIGSKVVAKLSQHGHEAIAAAPNTGVNTLTGEGLAEALTGAQVVIDVANSPSSEDGPALDFFTTATGNVLTAAESAGVSHVVALSVVGTERLQASGYFRAKAAQEELITQAAIPFSIVRATQFYEFVGRASRIRRPTATPCGSRPPSASPWRPMTSQPLSPAPRSASRSATSTKWPGPTGIHSTAWSGRGSARNPTPAASSQIRKRATSAWCSTTTPWFPPPPRRFSHALHGLAHRQCARSGPVIRRRNATGGDDHDNDRRSGRSPTQHVRIRRGTRHAVRR